MEEKKEAWSNEYARKKRKKEEKKKGRDNKVCTLLVCI
jgi:hypothetical protein